MAERFPFSFSDLFSKWDRAIEWFRSRIVITDPEFRDLRAKARRRAFWVANLSQLRLVDNVFELVSDSLKHGENYAGFKKRAGPLLRRAWGRGAKDAAGRVFNQGARIETIYRTNAQTAYQSSRFQYMNEPVIKQRRPYWFYDAIMDGRTSAICRDRDAAVRPADDPWWNENYPPLHFNCRSSVRALTARQAMRRGVTPQTDLTAAPVPGVGFGASPKEAELYQAQVNLDKVDPSLLRTFGKKQDENT